MSAYFDSFPKEHREQIEAISLTCGRPTSTPAGTRYPAPITRWCSTAFTSCAISSMPSTRSESRSTRRCLQAGDTTLTKSEYLWLTNSQNMTDQARARFAQLKTAELKTARAWALKEALRALWS